MPTFPASNTYPRRVIQDPNEWIDLVQAYSTYKMKKILAEGDSWLAYPQILGSKNITAQLADDLDKQLLILNIAKSGDEAVTMLSCSSNKSTLIDALINFEFDFLLFSGGGNDIVGLYDFDFFLKEKTAQSSWKDCIIDERIDRRISQIKNAYLDLIEYTGKYSKNKNIKIITHTYDKLVPNPKGVLGGKSWLYPYLVQYKIVDPADQVAIVNEIMTRFINMLDEVKESPITGNRFVVVNTCGLVKSNQWVNEIHPDSDGFKTVTNKIYDEAIK